MTMMSYSSGCVDLSHYYHYTPYRHLAVFVDGEYTRQSLTSKHILSIRFSVAPWCKLTHMTGSFTPSQEAGKIGTTI